MIVMDNTILYTALPTLTTDLGATGSQSLWIINAYPVVMAGLLLGAGTLGDRVGHRNMFLIGLSVFAAASLLAAFSPTAAVLIAARALLAVGAAAMMPATLALIASTFTDERERNSAFAIWGAASTIGMASGPVVGGALLEMFWWGAAFLINVPIALAAIVATILIAPVNDPNPAKNWDQLSSLWALIGLVGAVLTIKESAHPPQNWTLITVSLLLSVIGLTMFVLRQKRLSEPLLDFTLFRNRVFTAGVLGAGISLFPIVGIQLVTTQRFQLLEGFTPLQAGLLVAAIAAGNIPATLAGGALLHRTGLLPLISGGLAIAVGGVLVLMVGAESTLAVFIIGLVVTGVGLGFVGAVASNAILSNAPSHRAGMASSVEEVSFEFGSLTAVALIGSLVSLVYSLTIELPLGAPTSARESLADAVTSFDAVPGLFEAAHDAYATGYLIVLIVIAVILAFGALITGWLLRHHGPGTAVTASFSETDTHNTPKEART
ncbi:MFS transporter [Rhodococcus sp. NBC_00297]|uniref:MFS transporter n=1 Tax=Rhodococcus sp. NBC_00297 TaxID=2976005 RepID=UPI002E2D705A|nr:MFS transporter [Rhodococcus sp. NBC_00297]